MTEKSETPQILDELSKSNAANAGSRTTRKQQTARRRLIIVVVLVLSLISGLLLLGYQQFTIQKQMISLLDENAQMQLLLSARSAQITALEQSMASEREAVPVDDSAVRELESLVNQNTQNLNQRITQLQASIGEAGTPDQQWKILEAEYLLSIANQRLILESDIESAIALLESADNSLLNSGNNSVFAVRQSIASDLTRLRASTLPDREGIYIRLDNLVAEMGAIDLLSSMRENFENLRTNESQAVQLGNTTPGIFDSSLEFLGSIFVWRKWDEVPEAMLAPGQSALIKLNMQLMLEQAELALLSRDDALFKASLNKSKNWFLQYAVTQSASAQAVLAELDMLLAMDVDPQLDGIDRTLSLIAQLSNSETQVSR